LRLEDIEFGKEGPHISNPGRGSGELDKQLSAESDRFIEADGAIQASEAELAYADRSSTVLDGGHDQPAESAATKVVPNRKVVQPASAIRFGAAEADADEIVAPMGDDHQ